MRPPTPAFARTALRNRIAAGAAANIIGKFWVIAAQVAAVPLLTRAWGVHGYGVWLMLSAVPTYVALSGFGFGTAASVAMTRRLALDDKLGALRIFQSTHVLMSGAACAVFVIAVAIRLVLPHHIEMPRWSDAAVAMVGYSVLTVTTTVISVAWRSTGNYARGTILLDLFLPFEMGTAIAVALLGGDWLAATIAMICVRFIGSIGYFQSLRRRVPWLQLGPRHASWSSIRELAVPSSAAAGTLLAASLNVQGVLVAVGIFLSPSAAGLFGAARTYCRAPLQIVAVTTRATFPDLSAALARDDRRTVSRLMVLNISASLLLAAPAALLLTLYGPRLLQTLSGGQLSASHLLFGALAIAAVFASLSDTIGQLLAARVRQGAFAIVALLASALSILAPIALGSAGLGPVALALATIELALLIGALAVAYREGVLGPRSFRTAYPSQPSVPLPPSDL